MSRSDPLTPEELKKAGAAFKDETGNLFKILKNAFKEVIDASGSINLIIAVNQIPYWGRFRITKRVAYYITRRTRYYDYRNEDGSTVLDVRGYVHDINKRKKKDLEEKREVMKDWSVSTATEQDEKKGRVLILIGTDPLLITNSNVKDDQLKSLMNFFIYDQEIFENIDSITTIERGGKHLAKFIYDKDIWTPIFQGPVERAKVRASVRLLAEKEGHPSVFFKQEDQKKLLDEMRANENNTLTLFGKNNKSRKVVNSRKEIHRITKMISRIDKLIRQN